MSAALSRAGLNPWDANRSGDPEAELARLRRRFPGPPPISVIAERARTLAEAHAEAEELAKPKGE